MPRDAYMSMEVCYSPSENPSDGPVSMKLGVNEC